MQQLHRMRTQWQAAREARFNSVRELVVRALSWRG
jgi:hypothetical protein